MTTRIKIDDETLEVKCERLEKENESLKRRIFGLETSLANMRRKEEMKYKEYSWANGNGNI